MTFKSLVSDIFTSLSFSDVHAEAPPEEPEETQDKSDEKGEEVDSGEQEEDKGEAEGEEKEEKEETEEEEEEEEEEEVVDPKPKLEEGLSTFSLPSPSLPCFERALIENAICSAEKLLCSHSKDLSRLSRVCMGCSISRESAVTHS